MAVGMRRGEPHAGDFVGREDEMRVLAAALDATLTGQSRLVLIGGEPGIGKTRLVDEFVRAAGTGGVRTAWAKCWEEAGAPAYWPWIQIIRAYVRGVGEERARAEMGAGAADLASMLPELRDRLDDPVPSAAESDAARFRLFDSITTFLRNGAGREAMVLVVDDLHAADAPSIALLRFVAGQLGNARILIIGTFRDVELTPDHPLTRAIGELMREPNAQLVPVRGLPRAAVGSVLAAAGQRPNAQVAGVLWREARGNPLFMTEAARLLASEGRMDELGSGRAIHLAVPANVRDVIVRRARGIGDETVEVLAIGAALGPEFDLDVLRRVRGAATAELDEIVAGAVEGGLLSFVSGAAGRLRFTHDVTRESMYAEIAPLDRARLHLRIAATLEEVFADSIDLHLASLAHHHFEAGDAGDRDRALDYARRAGDQAARSLAYEEAARLYRMALVALPPAPRSDAARLDILLALGEAQARAGDLAAARTTFRDAAELARRSGSVRELAVAALGAGGRLLWARPGRDSGLIPLLQDALVLLGGTDEALRVRLLTRLACAWRSSPEHRDDSDALSAQAVAAARTLDDPASLAVALLGRFYATWWPENLDERVTIAREAVTMARASGDGELLVDAVLIEGMVLVDRGQVADGRRLIDGVKHIAEQLRQPPQHWLGTAPVRLLALAVGDFAEAERLLGSRAEERPSITPADDDVSADTMHRFLLRREQGRVAEVEDAVRAAARGLPWYPLHRAALACVLLDLGRPDEARGVMDELSRDRFRALYRDCEWLLGMSLVSEACAALADAPRAAILYEQLLPYASRHAVGHAEGSVGAVDRYLGLLAAAMGRESEAVAHLTDAVRLNDEMGLRPMAAHARAELGELLLRRPAPEARRQGARLVDEAVAIAQQLGMSALQHRITANGEDLSAAPGATDPDAALTRDGEFWSIRYAGSEFRLADAKGLRYLARLLAEPGRELLALDLARETHSGAPSTTSDPGLTTKGPGDAGDVLDPQAKDEYRRRLVELEAEASEAEAWNDGPRAESARREIEFLTREISRAVGLGGRVRRASSASERARVSVTRALRLVIERIGKHHPELGAHLSATIHTGLYCAYRPDPSAGRTWRT